MEFEMDQILSHWYWTLIPKQVWILELPTHPEPFLIKLEIDISSLMIVPSLASFKYFSISLWVDVIYTEDVIYA